MDEKKTTKKDAIEKRKERERQKELEEQQIKEKNRQFIIRSGVVAAILLVVAAIFIFKTLSDKAPEQAGEGTIPLSISQVDLNKIKAYGLPIVIDFGADSCVPCKQMAPVLVKLNAEWQGKAVVHFVDVWKNNSAASGFPISVIPTQIFFDAAGNPYTPSDEIQKTIEFEFTKDKVTGETSFTSHVGGLTEDELRQIFAEMGVV